jgi:uncharacterized protein
MSGKARIVVDTNVLVSRMLMSQSIAGKAASAAFENYTVIFSDDTLKELYSVLTRDKFDTYLSYEKRMGYVDVMLANAEIVATHENIEICTDPDDNMILDLAVQGDAALIITGDKALLALHPFMGIPILSPADFLQRLK